MEGVGSAGEASVITAEDFFDFRNQKSSGKDTNYPKLVAEISEVQFRKGETKVFRKTSFGESEYQIKKETPCKIKCPKRGVNAQQKQSYGENLQI